MNSIAIAFLLTTVACDRTTPITWNYTMADGPVVAPAELHADWDQLLKAHVRDGLVDYKGFVKDKGRLNAYCELLSKNAPSDKASKNTKLAYFINVYNAQTVKLIVDNYPVESIRDMHPTLKIPGVNSVWHVTKFKAGSTEMSLNDVEHEVLRKMDEPRIHFAINCASMSCPPLRNEAYTAEKIDAQLADQAKTFINTARYNKITKDHLELSKIFSWFEGDFKKNGSLILYLNKFSKVQIAESAKVDHLDYDWSLNEVK